MDITRGSLDGITRSGRLHQRQRPDSRVSLQSGSGSPALRLDSESRGSFEILPPDTSFDYQERDLSIEEYLSSTDEEENYTNRDVAEGDAIHQLEQLILSGDRSSHNSGSVSDVAEEDDVAGPPLNHNSKKCTNSTSPQQTAEDDDELNYIKDPKLRKAIKKMRKLDKILSQKLTREKEVKRQRLVMHKQYEEELDRIRLGLTRSEPKDEVENTMRFLALVPPPAHSEGIDNDEDHAASPLFRTQPVETEGMRNGPKRTGHAPSMSDMSSSSRQSSKDGDTEAEMETERSKGGRRRKLKADTRNRTTKDDDDFIQRNIQLASDAGNTIAMTDDEKKRLGELLQDVEMLGEETVAHKEVTGTEIQMLPGVGFQPNKSEEDALKDLDDKLKLLIPPESFQEICSTPSVRNHSSNSHIEYRQEAFDLGEKILQDTKEARDQQERLKQIEEELVQLQTQVEKEISSPSLSKDELDDLFRQCDDVDTRTKSALSSPRTPRPPPNNWSNGDCVSTLNHGGESVEPDTGGNSKLTDETLRRLLEEAKQGLGFQELSAEDELPDGISFGEDELAETEGASDETPGGGKLVQKSSNESRVPLVSHDVIQMLLRNPRATLEEANNPSVMESDAVGV